MIVRSPRPDRHFTILDNSLLRSGLLSLRAKGLLVMLLSYPDNWKTSSENLAKVCLEGRDAIRSALRELEEAGYLRRIKRQDDAGRWISENYIFDTPQESPGSSTIPPQPTPENPTSDNQALKEELSKKRRSSELVYNSRVKGLRICGQCSGSGWKPTGKSLSRCDCDSGIRR